jgi:heme exporter protein A
MSDAIPAVEAHGLCRRYGRRWALVDVSFELARGSILVVAGRNGSGKSTLLRLLATAIRPDRGSARIEGHDLRALDAVRRRVALLTHNLYLYGNLTALENLQVAARFLARPAERSALMPLLAEVGLADRADDTPLTFSAGMRKRLGFARVLLQDAAVVFLDEPYGQLDPPGFRMVDALLETLRRRGSTVLMATHLIQRAGEHGDRGLVLETGRVAWEGPARELARGSGLEGTGLQEGGA